MQSLFFSSPKQTHNFRLNSSSGCSCGLSRKLGKLVGRGCKGRQGPTGGKDAQRQVQTAHINRDNLPRKLDAVHQLDALDHPLSNLLVDHHKALIDRGGHRGLVQVEAALCVWKQGPANRGYSVLALLFVVVR